MWSSNVSKGKPRRSHLDLHRWPDNFQTPIEDSRLFVVILVSPSSHFHIERTGFYWRFLFFFTSVHQWTSHYLCRNGPARDPIRKHFIYGGDEKQMHSVWWENTVQRFTQHFRVNTGVRRSDKTREKEKKKEKKNWQATSAQCPCPIPTGLWTQTAL